MPDGVARLSGGIDEAGGLAVSQYVEGVIQSVLKSASSRFSMVACGAHCARFFGLPKRGGWFAEQSPGGRSQRMLRMLPLLPFTVTETFLKMK